MSRQFSAMHMTSPMDAEFAGALFRREFAVCPHNDGPQKAFAIGERQEVPPSFPLQFFGDWFRDRGRVINYTSNRTIGFLLVATTAAWVTVSIRERG